MVLESKRLVWIHPKWEIHLLNSIKVFETSAKEGYVLLAHAGEEGPTEYVWEAIDGLKIERIDHGNNCLTDENLVNDIIKRDMALTVCPLSNLELKVVSNLKNHPLNYVE